MPNNLLRDFMKRTSWTGSRTTDLKDSDHTKELPQPPLELCYDNTKRVIELPSPKDIQVDAIDLRDAIEKRVSVRNYAEEPISLEELSWLRARASKSLNYEARARIYIHSWVVRLHQNR